MKWKVIFFVALSASLSGAFSCDTASADTLNADSDTDQTASTSGLTFPNVSYSWISGELDSVNTIYYRYDCPGGCAHMLADTGSFGEWLRYLPLYPEGREVLLYNGNRKSRQDVHAGVVNIDVGNKDLQQCADAVMRLRSEYLFSTKQYSAIHFNYTSGDKCDYTEWSKGVRLRVDGNKVRREQTSNTAPLNDRKNFSAFLQNVFMFAGSLSLSRELVSVPVDSMKIGDVFIYGGTPGHAVVVVDMCQNADGTKKYFMIAQSYMPAQEIHILKNMNEPQLSPWYPLNFGDVLKTPEWDFRKSELMRFN